MKIEKKIIIIEISLIFVIFIVPAYFSQGAEVDPALFTSAKFNLAYIASAVPQTLLIIYLIYSRRGKNLSIFREYGFQPLDLSLIWKTALVFALTLFLAMMSSLILIIPRFTAAENVQPIQWTIPGLKVMPMVFLTCMATGYREEVIFRSYMMTELQRLGAGLWPRLLGTALLFAAGHLYQGLLAFFTTFIIGIYMGLMFQRFKNIHMIALGHGLYNFFSLIILPLLIKFYI